MKAGSPKLVRVAHRLAVTIDPDACLLVGAMAVAVHGHARATTDVDLIFRRSLREARTRLAERGVKAVLEHGGRHEGDFDRLAGVLEGIDFDILPALVPIDWENAVELPLGAREVLKVADLPTLIHLKLRAGGPQDVLDVVMLLQQHPDEVPTARELAGAYGLAAQLEAFMNSPRVRAKAPAPRRRG